MHTRLNGPFSGTTQVSWYQKGKTNLNLTEARDSEWQWHQLGRMQVCTLLQTDNHTSTPPLCFFTGWMPFLLTNEQRQSTEGNNLLLHHYEQKIFNNSGSTAMMPEDHRATTMHSAYIHHTIYRETSNQRLDNDNH